MPKCVFIIPAEEPFTPGFIDWDALREASKNYHITKFAGKLTFALVSKTETSKPHLYSFSMLLCALRFSWLSCLNNQSPRCRIDTIFFRNIWPRTALWVENYFPIISSSKKPNRWRNIFLYEQDLFLQTIVLIFLVFVNITKLILA